MSDVRKAEGSTQGYVPFEYALLKAVPRIDRGECVNVGVVVYCQARDYLGTAVHVDEPRLLALDRQADVDAVRAALAGVEAVCAGRETAGRAADGSRRGGVRWPAAPPPTHPPGRPARSGATRGPPAGPPRRPTP